MFAPTAGVNFMQLPNDPELQAGLATRRAVLGNDYVQGALDKATEFTAPLQELVPRHAWGNTWQRTGIALKTRSIVTVSMLVALGKMHELKIHVRGALNNGVTPQELQEIFMHASVYCGFPAALDAFKAGSEVLEAKYASGHQQPAGVGEGVPRRERCLAVTQPDHGLRDFLGLAETPHRMPRQHHGAHLVAEEAGAFGHRCLDDRGSDGVDPH